LRDPAKWELEEFAKLADMVDFLRIEYRPFTAIAGEAVRRRIIKKGETNRLYSCFSVCTERIAVFEGRFFPSDQTPTGRDRWEWKLKTDITKELFLEKVEAYTKTHFQDTFIHLKINL
jgi:hypothetical protein